VTVNLTGTALDLVVVDQTATQAAGTASADAGIASLVVTAASNVSLATTGAVGDAHWTWTLTLVNTALPGSGTLVLTDLNGASTSLTVNLTGSPVEVVVQNQTATQASGTATAAAGMASLVLTDATNVTLATSGAVGDTQWTWELTLVDPNVSGHGTLVATDSLGGTASLTVNLSGTAVQVVVQNQTTTSASGIATAQAGITSLVLTDASNVSLTTSGAVGDTQWTWHLTLVNPDAAGHRTLVATDSLANTAVLAVELPGRGPAIPALGTGGLVLLMLLIATAGVAVLRFGRP
jgi:hypothetical protein